MPDFPDDWGEVGCPPELRSPHRLRPFSRREIYADPYSDADMLRGIAAGLRDVSESAEIAGDKMKNLSIAFERGLVSRETYLKLLDKYSHEKKCRAGDLDFWDLI